MVVAFLSGGWVGTAVQGQGPVIIDMSAPRRPPGPVDEAAFEALDALEQRTRARNLTYWALLLGLGAAWPAWLARQEAIEGATAGTLAFLLVVVAFFLWLAAAGAKGRLTADRAWFTLFWHSVWFVGLLWFIHA